MKKIIVLVFAFLFLASLVSAAELRLTKVSDLKVGDVIVSKVGVEIPIDNITAKQSDQVTISEYLRQKVLGTSANAEDIRIPVEKIVASGNSGPGVVSGNAIVSLPASEKQTVSPLKKLINTIKGWFE